MKRYHHATVLEQPEEKALKQAKEKTGLSINQLLSACVREALPVICAKHANKNGRVTNVDPLPDHVLEKIYRERDEQDEKGVRRFMAVQAFGGED